MNMRNRFFSSGLTAAIAAGFTCAGPVLAQVPEPSPIAGLLSNQPGLNDVQRPAAVAIETFCPFLPSRNAQGSPVERLSNSCTTMVQNASSSQTPRALQAVAAEEMHAQGRMATSSLRGNAVSGRLLALRSGGRGLLLAGSNFNFGGARYSAADFLPAGSRGGGAAADSGLGSRWGGFINANYNRGDRDDSGREDSFDFYDYGLTGGIDYRFSDALVGGVAVSWSDTDVDFSGGLGGIESTNWGLTAYFSYTVGAWYVDGQLGAARIEYDTRRNIVVPLPIGFNSTAKGSTDADQWTASLGAGYDMKVGKATLTPYGRVDYLRLEVDGFTEKETLTGLGLDIRSQTTTSLQTALGVRASTPISTGAGVFTPYATLEWNHEYENDSDNLVAKYTHDPFNTTFAIPTEKPDRDFFTLGLGVSAVYPRGLSAFVNLDTVLGLNRTNSYAITVGLRGEF